MHSQPTTVVHGSPWSCSATVVRHWQVTSPMQQLFVIHPLVLLKHVNPPSCVSPFGDPSVEIF